MTNKTAIYIYVNKICELVIFKVHPPVLKISKKIIAWKKSYFLRYINC